MSEESPAIDEEDEIGALFDELEELEALVDSPQEREQVREAMRAATEVQDSDSAVFGRIVWGFDRSDLSEAVLGSLLFGIPMAVEGGTIDAGRHIAQHPLYLLGTIVSAVIMVIGILYVADIQDVRVHRPFLGVVPRRLVGVLAIAVGTAAGLLAAWGRLPAGAPTVAMAEVVVATLPAAVGAALGDILPGS